MGPNIIKYFFLTAILQVNQSKEKHSGSGATGNSTDNWPQFRGPDGQGDAPTANLALSWSEEEHVTWKFTGPGEGWSSPVVDDRRIWMTTACDIGRSLPALCLDLKSGKLMKDLEVFYVDTLHDKNSMNSYASPSSLIAEGKLYVHFGTYGTACMASGTGEILWKRSDLKLNHEVGPGSSPVIWHDNLIIPSDRKDVQYIIAISTSTGDVTRWHHLNLFKKFDTFEF